MKKLKKIGLLHPGQMGQFVAAMLLKGENEVYWVPQGRSEKTGKRAKDIALKEVADINQLCQNCSIIFSICPPAYAEQVARSVASCNYKGIYVDANAINPERSQKMGRMFDELSVDYVDGGIIGNPSWEKGATSLYLSGEKADYVASCFPETNLEVHTMGNEIGKASAIKMCFASYTKGTTALLSNILALAEDRGVRKHLEYEWSRDGAKLAENAKNRTSRVTAKAWRFEGEMNEIAATFAASSLPDGFHKAAEEIYRRMSKYKDAESFPSVEEVLASLLLK